MANEWPLQQVGSTGEDVRTVQLLLAVHGHPVAVDGVFGPLTAAAVVSAQTDAGVPADGIVGPQTWPVLLATVSIGAGGPAVQAAQGQLRSQGWRLALDGSFGPQTDRAVRDFQVARGLVVDGVVGPETWQTLVADFTRLGSPEAASAHLFDAWGASDRASALTNATQSAVDLLLRGARGELTSLGCAPHPQLGPGSFLCSYGFDGGAVSMLVQGNDLDGHYVEATSFIVD
jgi:peptidoglycan hydrolase-like protein with peptidoglycan-binding domain